MAGDYGDKFKAWCERKGRQIPSDEIVLALNDDPTEGRKLVRKDSDNPLVYRSLVTFMTMGKFQ